MGEKSDAGRQPAQLPGHLRSGLGPVVGVVRQAARHQPAYPRAHLGADLVQRPEPGLLVPEKKLTQLLAGQVERQRVKGMFARQQFIEDHPQGVNV